MSESSVHRKYIERQTKKGINISNETIQNLYRTKVDFIKVQYLKFWGTEAFSKKSVCVLD